MARTVGVRFRQAGKIFYYEGGDLPLEVGNYVVVETSHGRSVGRVVISPDQVLTDQAIGGEPLQPIIRLATQEDVEQGDAMKAKAAEDVIRAKGKVGELNLNLSIASGEYDLDGGQFTAYYTAPERIDFRNLVRDLAQELGTHVQLLQVGDRDRAKLTDGFDICGERLCCSSWMTNFPSVSIRMAKEQDLPLNPQKISGVCGRLYCCLTFEYDDYKALRGTLPKVGAILSTPAGEAKVTGIDFNREMVKLWLIEAHEQVEVAAIDFQLQNGVTIRPMELVRKIEGPLRTITEDSSAIPSRVQRPRPGRPAPPPPAPAGRSQQRGRPSARPAPPPPRAAQPPMPPPPQAAAPEGEAAANPNRRRRRRRGRGGGGGAPGGGPATPPPAS